MLETHNFTILLRKSLQEVFIFVEISDVQLVITLIYQGAQAGNASGVFFKFDFKVFMVDAFALVSSNGHVCG